MRASPSRQVGRLCVITPATADLSWMEALRAVLDAGAPMVQIRTKEGTDAQRYRVCAEAAAAVRASGTTCVVNDRVDLAMAVTADGVHLGADDLPVRAARRILGPGALVGATVRGPDDARRAVGDGASYLGAGPVFPTSTKVGLPEPIGVDGLAAICAAVDVPVLAISGITPERVVDCLTAGAHGVAVVGAVFGAANPGAAVRHLLEVIGEHTGDPR